MTTPLWKPNRFLAEHSTLKKYTEWLFIKRGLYFRDYDDLWDWSVTDLEDFWESIYQFFDVQSHTPYFDVLDRPQPGPPNWGMLGTRWFTGATVNYAEHIFRHKSVQHPALIFQAEGRDPFQMSWHVLERQVAAVAAYLRDAGVGMGDRVVSVLPNIPETVVSFLATASLGAVWSSCSPDFGTASIVDRFRQIEPKVLLAVDGYFYNGKLIDKTAVMQELRQALPTVERVIWVPYADLPAQNRLTGSDLWAEVVQTPNTGLYFEPVPFNDPIWVLYSSGTTGKPKAITHSVGGCLLEHLKALALHQDVRPGERYFWYSTTGWMMWNFGLASMLLGATLVLYEGAPAYPNLNALWDLAERAQVNHFGGGAAYFVSCMRGGVDGEPLRPIRTHTLTSLRTIGSTGSPLPPEGFRWVYEAVKKDVWLISFSGGTDICSGFVGGCPEVPVYAGEIQRRLLGCKLDAFNEAGEPVQNQLGEMVIREPMPSMPIFFWNDPNQERYRSSYFDTFPNVWRHGDFIRITEHNGVVIYGRSDATLNRDGVRIGTAEIYSAVESVPEVADSLVVGVDLPGGSYFMPLFVTLRDGQDLNDTLIGRIRQAIRTQYSPRHVPDAVYQVSEVPYTISGKKMEMPVKKILAGSDPQTVASRDTMRNPAALDGFVELVASGKIAVAK
ncbi:acetoacetate--CoA ligase [Rudanella lutea]|uniref:acetoacetate--CoA ligase n=1 Tax=Rudanella lutea TaxID=451374 RepID=UPI000361C9E8|nr:acetoacetate--CoA ligase [Rudanella lutea]